MKKSILSLLLIVFTISIAATQNGRFNRIRIKAPPSSNATDNILSIRPNGSVSKSTITIQDILNLGNPSLQSVTDVNNITTNPLIYSNSQNVVELGNSSITGSSALKLSTGLGFGLVSNLEISIQGSSGVLTDLRIPEYDDEIIYFPIEFSDGENTVNASSDGTVDLSSLSFSGAASNLQAVTDAGNTTSNNIIVGSGLPNATISPTSIALQVQGLGLAGVEFRATNVQSSFNILEAPFFGGTATIPISVNGNLADVSGNISVNSRPYEVFTALITQTGTNAPTVTILENTLGTTPVFSRSSLGAYIITVTGNEFTSDKTFVSFNSVFNQGSSEFPIFSVPEETLTENVIEFQTFENEGGLSDEILSKTGIEIRVYN